MHLPYSAPCPSKQDDLGNKDQERQTSAEHFAAAEASLSIGRVRPGIVSYGLWSWCCSEFPSDSVMEVKFTL
jgi:hypothetical protein